MEMADALLLLGQYRAAEPCALDAALHLSE